ncbi:MAG: hypothetical protein COT15_04860 [Candidatus Diapherotrites archaeon CG08_land_8_20_14_0_20_34_12]|nr:MAG: hypothetical protein COT15_04860 [Candidatus Diapherotrites archaeon CG08_land_8_20_14_0_20_34_12]
MKGVIEYIKSEIKEMLKERNAQGEWSSIYLLIILVIAALILISIVKPMFQSSQEIVTKTEKDLKAPATG